MKDLLMQGLEYLANLSPAQWEMIGTTILASGILSPVLMAVKKVLKVQKDLLMFGIVMSACFGVVAFAYIQDAIAVNPAVATLLLTVTTNIAYYAVFKPLKKQYAPKLAQAWANAKSLKTHKNTPVAEEDVPGRIQPQF